jgi:ATP-binding cassette subfamily F protein uup
VVKEAKAPRREPKASKRRLSFNEKHALESLPKSMAALQAKIRANQELLADPGLYARDRKTFEEASAALAAAQAELAAAEDKWLTLEILREEIDGG